MDPFAILDDFNKNNPPHSALKIKSECNHPNYVVENNTHVCEECGEELLEFLDVERPPDRHQDNLLATLSTNKPRIRTIQDKLAEMNFPVHIREQADDIYSRLTNGDIRRGEIRDSLILAAVFEAYQRSGDQSITMKSLREQFDLKRNRAHPGRKLVMIKAKKDRTINGTAYTSPLSLVPDILNKWEADYQCYEDIKKIYDKIEDKSDLIDRARPNSVAAGLVYYYVVATKRNNCGLTEFSKKVKLSETTIKKIAAEISNILRTPQIIPY